MDGACKKGLQGDKKARIMAKNLKIIIRRARKSRIEFDKKSNKNKVLKARLAFALQKTLIFKRVLFYSKKRRNICVDKSWFL